MSVKAEALWVDIETTGLLANEHVPLELGLMLTDKWGEQVGEPFQTLIYEDDNPKYAYSQWSDFIRNMHGATGLTHDLYEDFDAIKSRRDEADEDAVEWLKSYDVEPESLDFHGSSIGSLDRPFAIVHFPKLNVFSHYRNIDNSTLRELAKKFNPTIHATIEAEAEAWVASSGTTQHRVLSDIDQSIFRYRLYIENFLFVDLPDEA